MVNSGQRLKASPGDRNETIRMTGFGSVENPPEKCAVEPGQITGGHEIPIRRRNRERSFDAAERSAAGTEVRVNPAAKAGIPARRRNQCNRACSGADFAGNPVEQRFSLPGQQGFVRAHARALPARQHIPGPAHAKMIAPCVRKVTSHARVYDYNGENKCMSICFMLLLLLVPTAAQSGEKQQDSGGKASDGQAKIVIRVDPRSGRLVRQVVRPRGAAERKAASGSAIPGSRNTAPKANLSLKAPEGIEHLVEETARAHDIDPLLVHSVIAVESNYDPFALSPKGAEGLMQLIPSTARRFGVTNSFDPKQNIEGGVKYLKYLKTLFKDDRLALAAYNAGEGAVQKYGTVPPYQETRDYVQKVGKKLGEARALQVEPVAAEPEPEHPALEYYTDAEGRLYLRTRVREAAANTAME